MFFSFNVFFLFRRKHISDRFNAFQCFLVDFLSKLNKFCIGDSIPAAFPSPFTLSLYSPELCKLQCSGKKLLNDGNKNLVKCFVSYLHTGSAKNLCTFMGGSSACLTSRCIEICEFQGDFWNLLSVRWKRKKNFWFEFVWKFTYITWIESDKTGCFLRHTGSAISEVKLQNRFPLLCQCMEQNIFFASTEFLFSCHCYLYQSIFYLKSFFI